MTCHFPSFAVTHHFLRQIRGSFEYFDHYAGKVIDKNGYFFAFSVNCLEGGSKNGEVMYHVESPFFQNTFSYQCAQCEIANGR